MEMEKLPKSWNIRQKGKWIKDHFQEIDKSVLEVGKAETARQLGIYVGTLYNIYYQRRKPDYGRTKTKKTKKQVILNIKDVSLTKEAKEKKAKGVEVKLGKHRRGVSRSPLKAVDTLLKASKGRTFNNSLVRSVVVILEDYSKTKLELKSREEQVSILLEKIKKLEIELLGYTQSSKKESKERLNEVLERAKSSLITYGD